jgi:PAS domain S-box-containing protein
MLGYTIEEIIGKSGLDLVDAEQKELILKTRQELSKGSFINREFKFRCKDGKVLWTLCSSTQLLDGQGRYIGNLAMHSDITKRKTEEVELKRLNRTLKALSNSSQALMRTTSDEIPFLQNVCNIIVNDCGYKMVWIGYAKNDTDKIVKPVASAGLDHSYTSIMNISWDDNERGQSPTGTAIRTGETYFCRNMLTDPKFKPWREEAIKRGYASSLAIPLKDDGKIIGALTIYSAQPDPFLEDEIKLLTELSDDLTYGIKAIKLRKRHAKSEKVLRETTDYLENLINYANAPIIVWNPELKITRFNHAFERLTGLKADKFIGQPLEILFPEKSRTESMSLIKSTLSGERFEAVEIPILNYERLVRTVLWNSATIFDQENKVPIAMIAQGQDITEIKKADEEKNNFIAIMSHELRNPLTPILAGAQLINAILKKNSTTNDAQLLIPETAKIIEQQSQNMAHLLDDLLDISRISRGKIILKKQSIDLADYLKHAAKSVQSLIKTQKQELSIVIPEKPLYLEADPVRLEQIVVNLLNNAIKYTRPGGKINLIGSRDGDKAKIRIIDTGIGIEPEKINLLFKLFSRQAKSFISTQGELGIGLKLTKDLVALHSGTISAKSLGKNMGSEFIVEIPALPENYILELPKEKNITTFEKLRILVVDDNPSIAKLFSKMLELIGHDSRYCLDGTSALKLAAEYKPQIAMFDIGLPDISGHDVAIQLRKMGDSISPNLKLIAITGYGQDEDVNRSTKSGFNLHLVKPVNLDTLEKVLLEVYVV